MRGSEFLRSIVLGIALSCISHGLIARVISKQQVSSLRAISWKMLRTISLALGMYASSAVSAEHLAAEPEILCSGNSPECYAKAHHNPVKECKQIMDKKVTFRHIWLENEAPIFDSYLWHDEKKQTIQMFGQQAKAINSLGMQTPLQYYCVFNANTGEIIAASFE